MKINRDFLVLLPAYILTDINAVEAKYSKHPKYAETWEEYRKHTLGSKRKDLIMPSKFFAKLDKEEIKINSAPILKEVEPRVEAVKPIKVEPIKTEIKENTYAEKRTQPIKNESHKNFKKYSNSHN